jgi:flagellar basal body-associated protein FliL
MSVKKERSIVMSNIMKPPPEYSAYPVPGSTQHHRKSKRWVWIVLGVFALLCVLGGALVWTFAVNPAIAGEQYYIAIRDQDYAKAYTYLGPDLQARLSQDAFIQQAQQQDAALGRVSHYTYGNYPIGDPATATEVVTRAHGTTYTVHLELRLEGSAWKIAAFDRI